MPESNVYRYLQSRNERLVQLLDRNHSVSAFIKETVDHLIDYANHHGVPIEDIVVTDTHVAGHQSTEQYLVARIKRKPS